MEVMNLKTVYLSEDNYNGYITAISSLDDINVMTLLMNNVGSYFIDEFELDDEELFTLFEMIENEEIEVKSIEEIDLIEIKEDLLSEVRNMNSYNSKLIESLIENVTSEDLLSAVNELKLWWYKHYQT